MGGGNTYGMHFGCYYIFSLFWYIVVDHMRVDLAYNTVLQSCI